MLQIQNRFASMRQAKKETYAKRGVDLNDENNTKVDKEIVAEYVSKNLLTNEQSILSLTQESPSLGRRILNWLDSLIAKLGNKVSQERTFLLNARNLYAKALFQTQGSFNTDTSTTAPTNTAAPAAAEGTVQAKETHHSEENGAAADMSYEEMRQRAREMYNQGELSEAKYDEAMEQIDQLEEESAGNAENNTTGDGSVKYAIREIGDTGKFYVQADRQVIKGDDPNLWGKQIETYINEQIRKEQDVAIPTPDGHILLLTGRSAYKLKDNHVASIQKKVESILSAEDYALKGRAATHIDELIQVARFNGYDADLNNKHENDIGEDGFNYFEAFFRDFDGKYYRVPFSSALNAQEETVYSIGKIRQRSFPADRGSSSKKEALKNGRKASGNIIYTSESKSQGIKTAVELAYEKALNKKKSNEQFSISDQVSKQDVVSDLREILRRGGDPAELRRYVENMERGTERTVEVESADRQDAEVQEILNAAREQNISVDEYLRRNWEQYEYDGQLNPAARVALDQEKGNVQYSISSEELQDIQNIGRKSINNFTAADIAKTERFAQQYWNEMGVKSPFFRAWFGDWRVNDQTKVQIANVKGDARGVQKNTDTGWDIQVSGLVFAESKHFAKKNTSAIPYLPYINDIVEKAVLLDSFGLDVGKAKSENSLLMHSFYAIADIGNGVEILKLYVEEMNNPNTEHTNKRAYQLQNIEKTSAVNGGVQSNTPISLANTANATYTVADLFAAVKQKDAAFNPKPVSKLVNTDGTPKVYYHGTNAKWTQYDLSKNVNQMWGEGIYLTPDPKRAALFGDNVMPFYVKADVDNRTAKSTGKQRDYTIMKNGDVLVYSPEQIKSATDNIGTFDGSNPDIRYSISEDQNTGESTTTGEDLLEDPRSNLPRKAQDFLKRAENKLLNDLGEKLSVPKFARREYLRPIVQEISNEYLRTGTVANGQITEITKKRRRITGAVLYNLLKYKQIVYHINDSVTVFV